MKTILIDANSLFREGLRRILIGTPFRVASVVSAVEDISPGLLEKTRAGLVLLGTQRDHVGADAAVTYLKAKNPSLRVAVLTDHCELNEALALVRAGADGYLAKQISCDALLKALGLVMLGVKTLAIVDQPDAARQEVVAEPAAPAHATIATPAARGLSDREAGILHYLMRGDANKTIARQLDITEATVKVHIKAILRKIRVHNRTQAAIWAHSNMFEALPAVHPSSMLTNGHADRH